MTMMMVTTWKRGYTEISGNDSNINRIHEEITTGLKNRRIQNPVHRMLPFGQLSES
jgi:hypothetical protein